MAEENNKPMPESRIGNQLYQLLPAIYRGKDNTSETELGDLGRYLDAMGAYMDEIRATLDQRLEDNFPDNPLALAGQQQDIEDGGCQPWLLPYFAQLLDVHLVSPAVRGQREEVSRAVAWRQQKGTLTVAEEIAEAVAQMEVESQEGWRRVAVTPRIGMPLLPAWSYGVAEAFNVAIPARAARHPGLPAATMDMRNVSRAVQTSTDNPAAELSHFSGVAAPWRQAHHHGAPCFPGSYQDVSRRTVDMRNCDWRQGHYHPKRLLLYVEPPVGYFKRGWAQQTTRVIRLPIGVDEVVESDTEHVWDESDAGSLGRFEHQWSDRILDGRLVVKSGGLRLKRCAIRELVINSEVLDAEQLLLQAEDCLFESVTVDHGMAQLEYCTLLGDASFQLLNASDSIFCAELEINETTVTPKSCIRFSRIPKGFNLNRIRMRSSEETSNTMLMPVFYQIGYCAPWHDPEDESASVELIKGKATFGEPSCGVLHPATPKPIRFGAEDGGEMGAYHHLYYALRYNAVTDKIRDFLPVGMEVALVPDSTLYNIPLQDSNNNLAEANP